MQITTITPFPEEDFAWLKRQAKRRNLELFEIVNECMEGYMPDGFVIDRPMTHEEMGEHLTGLALAAVRWARLRIV